MDSGNFMTIDPALNWHFIKNIVKKLILFIYKSSIICYFIYALGHSAKLVLGLTKKQIPLSNLLKMVYN
jgi:hypothetical protein